ncbi:MAG TPA: thioredoxin [Candidatus Limnocylindria bacterium]|nr:thioredoxin [Candidatus Limnocylindria bacterium]
MAEIKVATDANFQELVLGSDRPVVVDFWAVWCGPCRMVAPEMEKLAAKYGDSIQVVKVDVDANPVLSQAFNIMSIPTIAFFRPGSDPAGKPYTPQGVVGFRPLEQLEAQFGLKQFLPAELPADQSATAA